MNNKIHSYEEKKEVVKTVDPLKKFNIIKRMYEETVTKNRNIEFENKIKRSIK